MKETLVGSSRRSVSPRICNALIMVVSLALILVAAPAFSASITVDATQLSEVTFRVYPVIPCSSS